MAQTTVAFADNIMYNAGGDVKLWSMAKVTAGGAEQGSLAIPSDARTVLIHALTGALEILSITSGTAGYTLSEGDKISFDQKNIAGATIYFNQAAQNDVAQFWVWHGQMN